MTEEFFLLSDHDLTLTSAAGDDHLILKVNVAPKGGRVIVNFIDSQGNKFPRKTDILDRTAIPLPYPGEGFTATIQSITPYSNWRFTAEFVNLTEADSPFISGGLYG